MPEELLMSRTTRRVFLRQLAAAGALAESGWGIAGAARGAPISAPSAIGWKWAICNETFAGWPFEKAFALAAQCGYQGIEVAPFTIATDVREISPARRAEVRSQAAKAHLEIVGLHWLLAKTEGFHLTSADVAVRRRTARYFGDLARFCADLGGKIMVLGSPRQRSLQPGVSRADAMGYAAEVLRMALPDLEATGVTLAIEPLRPKDTDFINTAAEGLELVRRVESPHFRLHLDCLAMSSEPTPIADLVRRYRSWLVHFHANDASGQGPGFGRTDFAPILRALAEISYRGWVSVEVFDMSAGPERIARESLQYMRKCLEGV
jgi:sugar phosphate isomerase/epimerase